MRSDTPKQFSCVSLPKLERARGRTNSDHLTIGAYRRHGHSLHLRVERFLLDQEGTEQSACAQIPKLNGVTHTSNECLSIRTDGD